MIFLAGGENVLKIVEPLPPQVVALHTAVDEIFKYFPSIFFFFATTKSFCFIFFLSFFGSTFPSTFIGIYRIFIRYGNEAESLKSCLNAQLRIKSF